MLHDFSMIVVKSVMIVGTVKMCLLGFGQCLVSAYDIGISSAWATIGLARVASQEAPNHILSSSSKTMAFVQRNIGIEDPKGSLVNIVNSSVNGDNLRSKGIQTINFVSRNIQIEDPKQIVTGSSNLLNAAITGENMVKVGKNSINFIARNLLIEDPKQALIDSYKNASNNWVPVVVAKLVMDKVTDKKVDITNL